MNKELKKQLERFSRVETHDVTWVHPWETYWKITDYKSGWSRHSSWLIKIFRARFQEYCFAECSTVDRLHIYPAIEIYKRKGNK